MKIHLLPHRAQQLTQLAREINDRQQVIEMQRSKFREAASALVCEAIFQGAALLKVKAILKHGDFMPWVQAHCPLISHATCNTYMRLAHAKRNLEEATSIREAVLLLCAPDQPDGAQAEIAPRTWPSWLQGLNWVGKFSRLLESNPVESWPEEGRQKLRQGFEPLAAQLWPDKFA